MIVCQILSAILLLLIPLGAVTGYLTLWMLLFIAFAAGCCRVFYETAYATYLPEIIKPESLQRGNAKLELSRGATEVGGPGLGGYLVQILGPSLAILADAFSFILSFLLLIFLPKSTVSYDNKNKKSIRSEIVVGLSFIMKHSFLRIVLISYNLSSLFTGIYFAISIIFMVRTLHLSAADIGIVFALGNIGFPVGAAIGHRMANRLGIGWTIVASLGLSALGFLITGFAPQSSPLPWLIAGQFLVSMGIPIYNIHFISLRQTVTPKQLLGRVTSATRVFGRVLSLLGATMGVGLVTFIDPRITVIIAGIGGILSLLPSVFSHVVKMKTIQDVQGG